MTITKQLAMLAILEPDGYWVEIVSHAIFPVGKRFFVVSDFGGEWLRCWCDGIPPKFLSCGTLLRTEHVRKDHE